jgi:hypothetical protein
MQNQTNVDGASIQSIVHASIREKPILFSAPMVRAILEGKKTQTRRIVKPQPPEWINELHGNELSKRAPYHIEDDEQRVFGWGFQDDHDRYYKFPYGKLGDRLWVRETHCQYGDGYIYRADYGQFTPISDGIGGPWKPSIHMPRKASRINLEIESVRVEGLNDISEADAKAEGIATSKPEFSFMTLWKSINGPDSWDSNPWVWVVQFRRV